MPEKVEQSILQGKKTRIPRNSLIEPRSLMLGRLSHSALIICNTARLGPARLDPIIKIPQTYRKIVETELLCLYKWMHGSFALFSNRIFECAKLCILEYHWSQAWLKTSKSFKSLQTWSRFFFSKAGWNFQIYLLLKILLNECGYKVHLITFDVERIYQTKKHEEKRQRN